MGRLLEEDTCTSLCVTFFQAIDLYPPSFRDSGVQDLPQSSSSPFQEHETVHKPPQVGDEARLLVLSDGVGSQQEGRAGDREGGGRRVEGRAEGEEGLWGGRPLGEGGELRG